MRGRRPARRRETHTDKEAWDSVFILAGKGGGGGLWMHRIKPWDKKGISRRFLRCGTMPPVDTTYTLSPRRGCATPPPPAGPSRRKIQGKGFAGKTQGQTPKLCQGMCTVLAWGKISGGIFVIRRQGHTANSVGHTRDTSMLTHNTASSTRALHHSCFPPPPPHTQEPHT